MKKSIRIWMLLFSFFNIFFSAKLSAQAKPTVPIEGTYRTIFDMLKEIPGIEVKSSNIKSGGSIVVRGITSLKNQQPPLLVLNGSIFNGDIASINVQDVDEIIVLKDAASTSVFGSQGIFGVLLITTKKGYVTVNKAVVTNHTESAYAYFIEHKNPLKVFGLNNDIIIEGVIQKQRDSSLVFLKKKKEIIVPISSIKKVEMIQQ